VSSDLDRLRLSYDQSVMEASGLRIELKQVQGELGRLTEVKEDMATEHAQYVEDLQKDHEILEERLQ